MNTVASPPSAAPLRVSAGAATLATAAQTVIGLVLYSYLIRQLGAASIGVWLALIAAGLLACMADLGLNHALIRQLSVALHKGERDLARATVETLAWAVALFTGAALIATLLSFPLWSAWLNLPAPAHADALRWLPFVLGGLWLNRLGDLLAGALDGQQRFVQRSLSSMGAQMCGLLLSLWWVPVWGMSGAALAFVVQNALWCVINMRVLVRAMPGLHFLRPRLRWPLLREAMRYGLSVQALVLCFLLLDSGVKLTLARGGNLAAVSYFDLAFRIGKGVRALVASALRVLVPRLAATGSGVSALAQRQASYSASFGAVQIAAVPVFVGLMAAADLISWAMTGHVEPLFVRALVSVLFAWMVYSLTDPALNLALASGRMRWPRLGHLLVVAVAAAIVATSWPQPPILGMYATVMFAMLAGCGVTWIGIHRSERLKLRASWPPGSALAFAGGAAITLLGVMAPQWLAPLPSLVRAAAVSAAYLAWIALLWRIHPAAQAMRTRLQGRNLPLTELNSAQRRG